MSNLLSFSRLCTYAAVGLTAMMPWSLQSLHLCLEVRSGGKADVRTKGCVLRVPHGWSALKNSLAKRVVVRTGVTVGGPIQES